MGLRRGLAGEHWAWLLLAGAAFFLRRTREEEEPATMLELAPGERYLVRLVGSGDGGRHRRGGRRHSGPAGPLADVVTAALEADARERERPATGPEASTAAVTAPEPAAD